METQDSLPLVVAKSAKSRDWQWQMKHLVTRKQILDCKLTESEREALSKDTNLPVAITPYYFSLINFEDAYDPIRKMVIPQIGEFSDEYGRDDPLGEENHRQSGCIVHRYPDRVLFLATKVCSVYCRYCTRSRMVGQRDCQKHLWIEGIEYIKSHPEIRDVLISGGDPLTMDDDSLDLLLGQIRAIKHIEIIRIGTKVPFVLPQRITNGLLNVLKKYHPVFISIHASHPREITPEAKDSCNRLANIGIPLGSQTVLLKDINDNPETMMHLFHGLLQCRVRPYYLYQCDLIHGSNHFRTPVSKGLEIIKSLRGFTTGYAIPTYVIDAPGGGGKIPLLPEYVEKRENGMLTLKNYEGKCYEYPLE
jgi:lysine 2,3-aminomutase